MFAIYKIENSITKDCYIGFTTLIDPEQRWLRHKSNAKRGLNFYLYRAIRKYGIDNFVFSIIEVGENVEYGHKIAEPLYIRWMRPSYNMTLGGDGVIGYIYSYEAKKAISESLRGHLHGPERRLANSLSRIGKVLSEEHKEAIRNGLVGKKKSEAHRLANSLAQKKRSYRLTEDRQAFNL